EVRSDTLRNWSRHRLLAVRANSSAVHKGGRPRRTKRGEGPGQCATDEAPTINRQAVFEGVEDAFGPASAEIRLGRIERTSAVKVRVSRDHEFARFGLCAKRSARVHEQSCD